jgi:hypothetical protein
MAGFRGFIEGLVARHVHQRPHHVATQPGSLVAQVVGNFTEEGCGQHGQGYGLRSGWQTDFA